MSEPPKTGTIHLHTWRDFNLTVYGLSPFIVSFAI